MMKDSQEVEGARKVRHQAALGCGDSTLSRCLGPASRSYTEQYGPKAARLEKGVTAVSYSVVGECQSIKHEHVPSQILTGIHHIPRWY